ncbi:MAG: acetamidase/formamidase family protein [Acidimicrobiales bacterium]
MATIEVAIDARLPLVEDPGSGHNRWHPDIEPVASCAPGDTLVFHTRDAADGQVTPDSTAAELAALDLGRVHPLTGPVLVEGAEPGDLLELDIEEVVPEAFAYTAVMPGFGFLRDVFPDPFLVRWRVADGVAVSEDLPGVAVPAEPFLGIVGVAPDRALLALARRREEEALARGDFLAPPTDAASAVPSGLVGEEGLRTGPPRENGGNLDVRFIGPGAQVLLPVMVEGALLSVGDAHFAQGDGEVCGLAVETRAKVRLRVGLRRGGARRGRATGPRLQLRRRGDVGDRTYIVTTGLSIAAGTTSLSENTTVAARNAVLDMIDHLSERGLTGEQAYVLCSAALELRISQVVDVPHAVVSALLPLDIFT